MEVSGYTFKYIEWPYSEVYLEGNICVLWSLPFYFFVVKSPNDVHIALAPDQKYEDGVNEDDVYEFVIGGW